jgi:hypothetical protein
MRCACPSDVHGYPKRFDEIILNALTRAAGIVGGGKAIEDAERAQAPQETAYPSPRSYGWVGDALVAGGQT